MQADNRFCRNCPHHRDGHIGHVHPHLIFGQLVSRACYGESLLGTPVTGCRCPEYLPKDNLEYLEYKWQEQVDKNA